MTTVTATDVDDGATQTYSLTGGADQTSFSINTSSGVLTFASTPDHETKDNYEVEVSVSDGTLTDTQTLSVTVADVNEAPVITSNGGGATATVSVDENQRAVTTVTATDVDGGATQSYAVSGGADAGSFAINTSSGVLTFAAAPDHEQRRTNYEVEVSVSDGSLTDTQTLSVSVADVNKAPVITSDGGGATATVSVDENQDAVTTVTATDVDDGATQSYSVSGGADAGSFAIDASSGALTFVAAPDHETKDSYEVEVTVSDGTLTDTQTLSVSVADVNEAPVITSNGGGATATVLVDENQDAVTTVTVTDVDDGATQTYSVSGGADAGSFAIDASSGVLTFVAAPDHETKDNYEVEVSVSDGTLTDTQTLSVTVADVNEAPVITSNGGGATATVLVNENQSVVTTVTATDVDDGATQSYNLTGGADQTSFAINASSGVLTFISTPDHETKDSYEVEVTVSDGTLTDTQTLSVSVADVNEAPVITSNGGWATATVSIDENQSVVTTVTATDVDDGATQTYSLTGGADQASFAIDASNGVLTLTSTPDHETKDKYEVEVSVSDGSLTDTQTLNVSVTDVNEAPVITSDGGGATATVSVDENQNAVTTVTATDVDDGATQSYSLTGGSDQTSFAINTSSGVLTFVAAPDHETKDSYEVEVTVSDGFLTDTQTLTVLVADVNEVPVSRDDRLTGEEDTALVIDVATDLLGNDSDPEGATLRLLDVTTPANGMLVRGLDGELEYRPNADFNGVDRFKYFVEDASGLRAMANVVVVVSAVNDPPTFAPPSNGETAERPDLIDAVRISAGWMPIEENAGRAGFVAAIDVDHGSVTFALVGTDAALFQIDPDTGELRPLVPLDFETPTDANGDNRYELELVVRDAAGGESRAPFTLLSVDVNEAPRLGGGVFDAIEGYSGVIGQLNATDPDRGDVLDFDLLDSSDDSGAFSLLSDGQIIAVNPGVGVHVLEVRVTDARGMFSLATVTVTIRSLSDGSGEPPLGFIRLGEPLAMPATEVLHGMAEPSAQRVEASMPAETVQVSDRPSIVRESLSPVFMPRFAFAPAVAANGPLLDVTIGLQPMHKASVALERIAPIRIDLSPFEYELTTPRLPTWLDAVEWVRRDLDALGDQAEANERLIATVTTVASLSISVGAAFWLLQSRLLLAVALAALPLWRPLDPVPILVAKDSRRGKPAGLSDGSDRNEPSGSGDG